MSQKLSHCTAPGATRRARANCSCVSACWLSTLPVRTSPPYTHTIVGVGGICGFCCQSPCQLYNNERLLRTVFFPAVYATFAALGSRPRKQTAVWTVALSLCQPAAILIDHGHFQYNNIGLGLAVRQTGCSRIGSAQGLPGNSTSLHNIDETPHHEI